MRFPTSKINAISTKLLDGMIADVSNRAAIANIGTRLAGGL
jgi:hypothetical protein